MALNTAQFEITDGPGKFDLMLALFDKKTRSVRFELQVLDVDRDRFSKTVYWVDVSIQSVERENRDVDWEWNLSGRIEGSNCQLLRTWEHDPEKGHEIFTASYSAQTRKGTMKFPGIWNPERR